MKRIRTATRLESGSNPKRRSRLLQAIAARRLRLEPLEQRELLTAVSWDGGGDGSNWTDPLNWSNNLVPGAADDVTINVPGIITVTHASGIHTIRSLTSTEDLDLTGGAIIVTNGVSSISGNLTVEGAALEANGATASFTASGAVSLTYSNLTAQNGATLDLSTATTYAEGPGVTSLQAIGGSSKLDLSGITSITSSTGGVNISATGGGLIELENLPAITARDINVTADGASSTVKLNALTSWTDSLVLGNLTRANGGDVQVPALATFNGGAIIVTNMSATFAALTNFNDSSALLTGTGQTLALPAVTTYSLNTFINSLLQVSGAGSKLDLTGWTSITGSIGGIRISAQTGGEVELDSLTTLTARDVDATADGTGSIVDFSSLPSWSDSQLLANLNMLNNGLVQVPLMTTMNGGTISVTNMSTSLPVITNFNTSSAIVSGTGAALSLPSVTSYSLDVFTNTFLQASGTGAKLDLTGWTSITGSNGGIRINAQSGGEVELDSLATLTARDVDATADGASSVVDFSVLPSWTDSALLANLNMSNGGVVQVPLMTTMNGGAITVTNMSTSFPVITNFNTSSAIVSGTGAVLSLPSVTSYSLGAFTNTFLQASGSGAKLDLTGWTSITGSNGGIRINALSGGEVELDSLTTLTARDVDATADASGGVVDFAVLPSWTDSSLLANLNMSNGGVVQVPLMTTMNGGAITVTNMSTSFPVITNFNTSSAIVSGTGAVLSLPSVTSYSLAVFTTGFLQATGAGAKLDLTGWTSITGSNGGIRINALSGGEVELDSLTTLTARDVDATADASGGVVDFAVLPSWTDSSLLANLNMSNGGVVQVPLMTTMNGGTITVTNMSASFPAITNFNTSSALVSGTGAVLSLPSVTSYSLAVFATGVLQSSGTGSKLDLTGWASLTGANGAIQIKGLSGGEVELDSLTTLTARDVDATADGVGSTVELSSLASWTDASALGNIFATNSGTVQMHGGAVALTGVNISVLASGVVTGGSIQLNNPGVFFGNGGSVNANLSSLGGSTTPGNPTNTPGRVTVNGNYSQNAAATFGVDVNGVTAGTNYDQLVVNGTISLGGTLTIARTYAPAIGESFTIIDNDGADPVVGTFASSPEGDVYTIGGLPFRLSYTGGTGNDVTLTRVANLDVNRRLFYNNSRYDGNNPAINTNDDLAIATDKVALLPGAGPATFANVSSYTRGINGIFIDLAGPHGTLTVSDFIFKVGNNNTPSGWSAAPAPTSLSVRTGAGYRGADRIVLTWADGSITKKWLEVIVRGNDTAGGNNTNTGLPASDIFFFGNAMGDSGLGDTATQANVSVTDEIGARNNPQSVFNNIPTSNVFDYNRDGAVNTTDALVSRNNPTSIGNVVRFLNIANPPAAPEVAPASDNGVASALALSSAAAAGGDKPLASQREASPSPPVTRRGSAVARAFAELADTANGPRPDGAAATAFDDWPLFDDELLDELVGSLHQQ